MNAEPINDLQRDIVRRGIDTLNALKTSPSPCEHLKAGHAQMKFACIEHAEAGLLCERCMEYHAMEHDDHCSACGASPSTPCFARVEWPIDYGAPAVAVEFDLDLSGLSQMLGCFCHDHAVEVARPIDVEELRRRNT